MTKSRFSSDGSGQNTSRQDASVAIEPVSISSELSSASQSSSDELPPLTPRKQQSDNVGSSSGSPEAGHLLSQLIHTPPSRQQKLAQQHAASASVSVASEFKMSVTVSPFKGEHAANYASSVNLIAAKLLKPSDSSSSTTFLAKAVVIADDHNPDLIRIRKFIRDFWSHQPNLDATRAAYADRNEAQSTAINGEKSFLEQAKACLEDLSVTVHTKLQQLEISTKEAVVKDIQELVARLVCWSQSHAQEISNIRVDHVLLSELISDVIDNLNFGNLDEAEEDAESQLEMLETRLQFAESEIVSNLKAMVAQIKAANKKQQLVAAKVDNITDPLCLSFSMVADKHKRAAFCLVSISSPEKNTALYQLLAAFIEGSQYKSHYVLAEAPSKNFQKMMSHVSGLLSDSLSRHVYRECAEKSSISTLTKLCSELETELHVINLYNIAFYPVPKKKPAPDLLDITVNENAFTVKLIPPCDDCKKRMNTDHLLLESANSQMIIPSPLKQTVLRQQSAGSASSVASSRHPMSFLTRLAKDSSASGGLAPLERRSPEKQALAQAGADTSKKSTQEASDPSLPARMF
jgi:hypothetical protein